MVEQRQVEQMHANLCSGKRIHSIEISRHLVLSEGVTLLFD